MRGPPATPAGAPAAAPVLRPNSMTAAAARAAATRQAAAQEVCFDRHLALCSFTLHSATQVRAVAPTCPQHSAVPCCDGHQGCTKRCGPPPGSPLGPVPAPAAIMPCSALRFWPGPPFLGGSASSACCPSSSPHQSTSFPLWRPWPTCGGEPGRLAFTGWPSLPFPCCARREVGRRRSSHATPPTRACGPPPLTWHGCCTAPATAGTRPGAAPPGALLAGLPGPRPRRFPRSALPYQPPVRPPSAGIQRVLDAQPQPGLHGALKDLLKIIWGEARFAAPPAACQRPATALHVPLLPGSAASTALLPANSRIGTASWLGSRCTAACQQPSRPWLLPAGIALAPARPALARHAPAPPWPSSQPP